MTTTREHIQLYWKFRDKAEKIVLPFLLVSDFVRKDAKLSEFSNFGYKLFPYPVDVASVAIGQGLSFRLWPSESLHNSISSVPVIHLTNICHSPALNHCSRVQGYTSK